MELKLTRGKTVQIDEADYDLIKSYVWFAILNHGTHWYAATNVNKKTVLMHRFLMNTAMGMICDHIDGDGLNNRRGNLRNCTRTQNQMNMKTHKDNSSKLKGVTPWKGKYMAQITYSGGRHYLGLHDTAESAARAYDEVALREFGEYARLNYPEQKF